MNNWLQVTEWADAGAGIHLQPCELQTQAANGLFSEDVSMQRRQG